MDYEPVAAGTDGSPRFGNVYVNPTSYRSFMPINSAYWQVARGWASITGLATATPGDSGRPFTRVVETEDPADPRHQPSARLISNGRVIAGALSRASVSPR